MMEIESPLLERQEQQPWMVRNPKKSIVAALAIALVVVVAAGAVVNKSNLSDAQMGAFNSDSAMAEAMKPLSSEIKGEKLSGQVVDEKDLKIPAGATVTSDDPTGEEYFGLENESGNKEVDDPTLDEDDEGKFLSVVGDGVETTEHEEIVKDGKGIAAKPDVTRRRRCYRQTMCLRRSCTVRRMCKYHVYRRCYRLRGGHYHCALYRRGGRYCHRRRVCNGRCLQTRRVSRCFSCPSAAVIRKCESCLESRYAFWYNSWWARRQRARAKISSGWLYHGRCYRQCSFYCSH